MSQLLYKDATLDAVAELDVSAGEADGGAITAYAATFDREPDSYGDVIRKGAFQKSLIKWQQSGNPIPLLFGHRTDDPMMNIGKVVSAVEDDKGLLIEAKFDADNPNAQYARKLVMEGRLVKLSFAYRTLDAERVVLDDGTRANELRELDLYEVSLVPIPANQHAEIIDVKAGDADDDQADDAAGVEAQPAYDRDFEKAALLQAIGLIDSVISRLGMRGDGRDDPAEIDSDGHEATEGDPSATEASVAGGKGSPDADFLAKFYHYLNKE